MADAKPLCKYGAKCYRKNPAHLADFRHPVDAAAAADDDKADDESEASPQAQAPVVATPESVAAKTTADSTTEGADDDDDDDNNKADDDDASEAVADVATAAAAVVAASPPRPAAATADDGEPPRKKAALASPTSTSAATPVPQQCFDSDNDRAQRDEYARLILDRRAFIREKFLVSMPSDFYAFWEFCSALNPAAPADALVPLQLRLVGPFDVLAGRFDNAAPREPADYLRHWRFYYDPPELQTVLVCCGKREGLHFGYWRDEPQRCVDPATAGADIDNVLVAQTDCDQGCAVQLVAENLFAAVIRYIDQKLWSPFQQAQATAVRQKLLACTRTAGIRVAEPEALATRLRQRNATVVTRTFHTAGLVVPLDRETQVGYRPLQETPAALRKILARLDETDDVDGEAVVSLVMEKLQPLVTAANIAVDESDFGTAIELGVNFFCHGSQRLHGLAMQLLAIGYTMVRRPQLLAIMKAHLAQRRHGKNMSIL